jgi:NADH:ubiquinone oxidoreductase subunit 6 (subunit J)
MQIHLFLLDLFASIALISAAMTIAAKNPIHSVAFLTLVSCNATGPLVPLGIEFIALMFIIIYVGAIAAPFLSAATTSNTKANESREN